MEKNGEKNADQERGALWFFWKTKKHDNLNTMYLIVDVNSSSNLPTAACDRLQPLVIMVTSCCIGVLVVELQSTLGQKPLS